MTHTVLLVDDDPNVLHCLGRLLQNQPYQLYTARSGEEALRMLNSRRVDVVVSDERMPGMSGSDLLAWVASNAPDVVRIMLTGYASVETMLRAINEGGVCYVFTKPCNEAHLAITIRRALENKDLAKKHAQLLERNEQQTEDRERFAKDLEVLDRLISRDLQKPVQLVTQSCQSLLEHHDDLFDPKATSLIRETVDAVSDMQAFVADLLGRVRAWQSTGLYRDSCAEPLASVGRSP